MKKISLSFMGVQPLNIDSDIYIELLEKKVSFLQSDMSESAQPFLWLKNYNQIYDTYHDLKIWDLVDKKFDLKDFFRNTFAYNMREEVIDLSEYLTHYHAKLVYDPRFVYFILVYEIHFILPDHILSSFLDYDPTQSNINYNDLYNTVRMAIVKEDTESHLSSWGESIQYIACSKAKSVLQDIYKIKIENDKVNILPNTCNISNFVLLPEDYNLFLVEKLIALNVFAERLSSEIEMKPLYNDTVYFSFNGRFHTIIMKNQQDKYRFQPLQFHIQYMWFLVERYNKIMNMINKILMQTDTLKILQKYLYLINIMINKIELLSLHDMNFKHSIEVDIDIYEKNEKRWSISNLLQSSKQYVSFFKDYLDRSFAQKSDRYQKKMNLILLVISFLQVLALISVWNDYLSTLNKSNLNIDDRLLKFFDNNIENLLTFNLLFPIGMIVVMLSFSYYLWKHRIR